MSKFTIVKSAVINASIEKVYQSVRDFHQWPLWSPWLIAEPQCKIEVANNGLAYSWEGEIVGSGVMAVTSEEKNDSIGYRLTFLKPWKTVSLVEFSFEQARSGVKTTWILEGSLPFFLFWMKQRMTAGIGMDYQRGLAMLKDLVETGSVPSKLDFVGKTQYPGCRYVGLHTRCKIAEISGRISKDFQKLEKLIPHKGLDSAGAPIAIYDTFDPVKGTTSFTAGIPVTHVPAALSDGFFVGEIPSCQTYTITHTGPYRHLGNPWAAGMMHERAKVFKQNKKIHPFETYETDAGQVDENNLITRVHFPMV